MQKYFQWAKNYVNSVLHPGTQTSTLTFHHLINFEQGDRRSGNCFLCFFFFQVFVCLLIFLYDFHKLLAFGPAIEKWFIYFVHFSSSNFVYFFVHLLIFLLPGRSSQIARFLPNNSCHAVSQHLTTLLEQRDPARPFVFSPIIGGL